MRPTIFLMHGRCRRPQNPDKVPFVMQMPLALKNTVTGKGSKLKERGCLYEISVVLACLTQNDFEDKRCANEITLFHNCYETYLTKNFVSKDEARRGILTPNAKNLKHNQINQLLRKYPQP